MYQHIQVPSQGEKITFKRLYGAHVYLPEETLTVLKEYVVSIKGPLSAPPTGDIRSLNVAIRQELDLYVCLRPLRYLKGVPSPVREPEKTNIVLFRENSEDIYAGIEYAAQSQAAQKLIAFLTNELGAKSIRFPETSGIGIKPVSSEGTHRLMRKAIQYAIDHDLPSVTIVHKGSIMKYTEGAFRDWAYQLAQAEFSAKLIDDGPWCLIQNPKTGKNITVKDIAMDAFLQQILMRPQEFSVVASLNLNGDYISDAVSAQVGGIGIAPGANMSDSVACFEATVDAMAKYARVRLKSVALGLVRSWLISCDVTLPSKKASLTCTKKIKASCLNHSCPCTLSRVNTSPACRAMN